MRMFRRCVASLLLVVSFVAVSCAQDRPSTPLVIDALGKGAVPLSDPWQFHLGDDASFASPQLDDSTGHAGWTQISTDKSWGEQGYRGYTGYAWYRRHLSITAAADTDGKFDLQIPFFESIAAIYWNGKLVGATGKMPPYPEWPAFGCSCTSLARTISLGSVRDGVLAIRVWMRPKGALDSGLLGGFGQSIYIGSPEAIGDREKSAAYEFLRKTEYAYALECLGALVGLFSMIAWLRDRSQRVLLWVAVYCAAQVTLTLVELAGPAFTFSERGVLFGLSYAFSAIATWFLLIHLLRFDGMRKLALGARITACISAAAILIDTVGTLPLFDLGNPQVARNVQGIDSVLMPIFTLCHFFPLVIFVVFLRHRQRLDAARWLVAIFAFAEQVFNIAWFTLTVLSGVVRRDLASIIWKPLFTLGGTDFNAGTLASTGFFIAIIYAALRYSREALGRQQIMEQEFRSAQALQQVLIPQSLPALPGFALTSSYRPAQEVGGDFFQVIPDRSGSTVIVLGDVSGKGLGAAMAVSLIVGTVRTLVRNDSRPSVILEGLNEELHGRLSGGFATCLVMRLDATGHCTIASAGHPAPLLNGKEVAIPGALPLGIVSSARYDETELHLDTDDFVVLYSDGLLEARSATGEIFSFERLARLAADRPSAEQALEAAQQFGQEDDITVLTLTRVAAGEEAVSELTRISHSH
jgi:Stage II sporulation protein E (SpoIIE)